jgi:hypothetical protein
MMKFEEGNDYPFVVRNLIRLPDDEYFVIEYRDGRKFMMKKKYYGSEYGLIPGKEIICRVDKINCNGRIFFEPHHPYFRPGMRAEFEITGESTRKFKKTDGIYRVLTCRGDKNEPAIIKETDTGNIHLFKPGNKVSALVKKVSKGEAHLTEVTRV